MRKEKKEEKRKMKKIKNERKRKNGSKEKMKKGVIIGANKVESKEFGGIKKRKRGGK